MGGIRAWQGLAVKGPEGQGFEYLPDDGDPIEILTIVFGLENGLKGYYSDLAVSAPPTLAQTLEKLAKLEDGHLRLIYSRLKAAAPASPSLEELAAQSSVPAVEGGLTVKEFLNLYRPVMDEAVQAVETGMMFEAQALDLYSRFGRGLEQGPVRELMAELAAEEGDHLKVLGRLLEEIS